MRMALCKIILLDGKRKAGVIFFIIASLETAKCIPDGEGQMTIRISKPLAWERFSENVATDALLPAENVWAILQ